MFRWQTEAILLSQNGSITLLSSEMLMKLLQYLNGKYYQFDLQGRRYHIVVC